MKTFTKKSLSVVLAVLMALSTLTVGAMSAFADTRKVAQYYDNITTKYLEVNQLEAVSFKAPKTGWYSVVLTPYEIDAASGTAAASFDVFNTSEKDATVSVGDSIAADSSNNVTLLYGVTSDGILVPNKAYVPAQDMVELTKGETYNIELTANSNTNASLLVVYSDYIYSFGTYQADLTWNYEMRENGLVYPEERTLTDSRTVGICAEVNGYQGTETALSVPGAFGGYVVKEVVLSNTPKSLKERITSVAIPEGVEAIGGMSNFYSLTSVNFPASLKTVYGSAFSGCHSLAGRITVPAGVERIGGSAFYDTAVTSVEFLSKETTVGEMAFGYKEVLNDATASPLDTTFAKADGFFVIAPANSPAAKYAADNGFTAYDRANCIAGNHPYAVTTVPATLFANGSKTSVCPVCGNTVKTVIKKKTFKISSAKSSKKNTLVVKAPAQKGITGYVVEVSTSKKFTKKTTKKTTVKTKKALNKTIKGLKGGKKYYVRVRATGVNAKGKKVYSKYTAVKSVKIKK